MTSKSDWNHKEQQANNNGCREGYYFPCFTRHCVFLLQNSLSKLYFYLPHILGSLADRQATMDKIQLPILVYVRTLIFQPLHATAPPILKRFDISIDHWLELSTKFESRFKGTAGSAESIKKKNSGVRLIMLFNY